MHFVSFSPETLVSNGEDGEQYDSLRYRWGIPEGPVDLPPGNCLPLESNLTIMNGGERLAAVH